MEQKLERLSYDGLIIGGGPAGCAAAISLRQKGLSTLVLDKPKKNIIEDEHPSESVHPGITTVLAKLGATGCIDISSRGMYEGIQRGNTFSPLGSDETGTWVGYHICRKKFDEELLKCVEQEGAEVSKSVELRNLIIEDDRVIGIETVTGQKIFSRYVIDASGYKCVVGKKLKITARYFSPNLFTWTGISHSSGKHAIYESNITKFIPCKNGWTWLAPETAHRCTWTKLSVERTRSFHAPEELKEFDLLGRVRMANRRWRLFRPLCKAGVILCGDAGGILDPAAGQGILNALVSGIMAANTIIAITKDPNKEVAFLTSYDKWFFNYYMHAVEKLKHFYAGNNIKFDSD